MSFAPGSSKRRLRKRPSVSTTGTQEGTVPHQDKPARIPWPLGDYRTCIMLGCASVRLGAWFLETNEDRVLHFRMGPPTP
eukprot:5809402-Prymnesium_polylepis.2